MKIKRWPSIASTATLDKTALCIDIASYIKGNQSMKFKCDSRLSNVMRNAKSDAMKYRDYCTVVSDPFGMISSIMVITKPQHAVLIIQIM